MSIFTFLFPIRILLWLIEISEALRMKSIHLSKLQLLKLKFVIIDTQGESKYEPGQEKITPVVFKSIHKCRQYLYILS